VPLYVSYSSTQLDFAVSFLRAHPNTKLVSVGLGANDVLLLRAQCADDPTCIGLGLPQVLAAVETNLAAILRDLRAAGFKRTIVVVNYYSVDYSDANQTAITAALNQALETAASTQAASVVADVFTAFQVIACIRWRAHMQCGTPEWIRTGSVRVRHSSQPVRPKTRSTHRRTDLVIEQIMQ